MGSEGVCSTSRRVALVSVLEMELLTSPSDITSEGATEC